MPEKKHEPYEFEVLRTGTFVDANGRNVVISQLDLQELSDSYDAVASPSPLVAGHPKDNDPALGWADSFKVVGDKLIGYSKRIHENLIKAVNKEQYKKISLSMYEPDATSNPVPGKKYIRHVGFLGAAAPAVPGLKTLSFSDDDSGFTEIELSDVSFSQSTRADKTTASILGNIREFIIDKFSIKEADKIIPMWGIDSIKESATTRETIKNNSTSNVDTEFTEITQTSEETQMTEDETKQLQTNLSAANIKITDLETEVTKLKKTIRDNEQLSKAKEINDFCEQLIKDGNILPADKDMHVQLMNSLSVEEIEFSEQKTNPLEIYKKSISRKKSGIDFSEKSASQDGYQSPVDKLNESSKIQSFADKNNISFSEAASKMEITV